MAYHLVCVHPFADYDVGQRVTDKDEVERLMANRESNFVRVAAPEENEKAEKSAEPVEQESPKIGLRQPRRNPV